MIYRISEQQIITDKNKAESGLHDLLHCPFCGGKGITVRRYIKETRYIAWYVGCYSKQCLVNPSSHFQNSELGNEGWTKPIQILSHILKIKAINAWNQRAR